jgi:hypothetical protein
VIIEIAAAVLLIQSLKVISGLIERRHDVLYFISKEVARGP